MKNLLHFLTTLLMFAGISIALSGIFTGGKWILSKMSICEPATFKDFLYGAIGLFVIMILLGIWSVIKKIFL